LPNHARVTNGQDTGARRAVPLTPRQAARVVASVGREGRGRVGLQVYRTGRQTVRSATAVAVFQNVRPLRGGNGLCDASTTVRPGSKTQRYRVGMINESHSHALSALSLHVAARRCTSLHVAARRCTSLHVSGEPGRHVLRSSDSRGVTVILPNPSHAAPRAC
jgi:hypothetical protein